MKYFEVLFSILYLVSVLYMSIKMIKWGKNSRIVRLFGYMGFILGFGDSFHLVPRIYALLTTGLEANAAVLGIGKAITSITMTAFYVLLFLIWETRFNIRDDKKLRIAVGVLAAARLVLSLMPQNQWTLYNAPLDWGIYRNIPFAILGAIIVYISLKEAKRHSDNVFRKIGIAVIISFACYLPVVLFANTFSLIGILMIPKTIAYLWVVYIGYKAASAPSVFQEAEARCGIKTQP
ncbi:MAG TPA: hypothetical protein DHD79_11755 [Firmicutes bacterium]|nr:hypothetical protein [Bacillota bacterium]HAW69782.1 hypothetical protein [Bacillota bacterium]HAZ22912.1 hypothetical protein [Bacillota bacterium]HBE07167.1 hypothetical protein [Bacillota bacterium]HBL50250.1 hypothetical protein [Bacillota bacterium]